MTVRDLAGYRFHANATTTGFACPLNRPCNLFLAARRMRCCILLCSPDISLACVPLLPASVKPSDESLSTSYRRSLYRDSAMMIKRLLTAGLPLLPVAIAYKWNEPTQSDMTSAQPNPPIFSSATVQGMRHVMVMPEERCPDISSFTVLGTEREVVSRAWKLSWQ